MRVSSTFACALLALLPLAANAQDRFFGPEIGVFIPNDSSLRDALGSQWWSIGLSTMREGQVLQRRVGTNLNFASQSKNGNKVFLGSYTIGLVQPFGEMTRQSEFQPYFAVRGGLSYTDYAVTQGIQRLSAKRVGYNVNGEVGVLIGNRFGLSARYDITPDYDGFNFDGWSFALRYGIAKF